MIFRVSKNATTLLATVSTTMAVSNLLQLFSSTFTSVLKILMDGSYLSVSCKTEMNANLR